MIDAEQYKVAITATGKYEAACNVFHLMEGYSSSAGVPYNRVAIQHVMDHVFKSPKETRKKPLESEALPMQMMLLDLSLIHI